MSTLAEKRVYGESTGPTVLALACPVGVATVAVADDRVGEFGLALRCDARDLAVTAATTEPESATDAADAADATDTARSAVSALAVATPDDVLVADATGDRGAREADDSGGADGSGGANDPSAPAASMSDLSAERTGFGPAVAVSCLPSPSGVGATADPVLAAGPDGRTARRDEGTWTDLGTLPPVGALDGALAATADGVWELRDGEPPERVALGGRRVADVATGVPLAATPDGLFDLRGSPSPADGTASRILEGSYRVVASESGGEGTADGAWPAGGEGPSTSVGRAHAATDDALFARDPAEGTWSPADVPVDESVADVAYGAGSVAGETRAVAGITYAVTVDGTLLVDAGDGWRSRALGLQGVRGMAVVG